MLVPISTICRKASETEAIVLHIASIVTVNPDYSQKVMDVNVGGTENLIALCKERNVAKLVYCSSTGAIPEEKNGVIRECEGAIPIDPNRIRGCYSLSKALATNLTLKAAEDGLNACVVHPSGIMGPEDYAMGETTKRMLYSWKRTGELQGLHPPGCRRKRL